MTMVEKLEFIRSNPCKRIICIQKCEGDELRLGNIINELNVVEV